MTNLLLTAISDNRPVLTFRFAAILDAEDAPIQVQSEIGKGSVFTVRFPVTT